MSRKLLTWNIYLSIIGCSSISQYVTKYKINRGIIKNEFINLVTYLNPETLPKPLQYTFVDILSFLEDEQARDKRMIKFSSQDLRDNFDLGQHIIDYILDNNLLDKLSDGWNDEDL